MSTPMKKLPGVLSFQRGIVISDAAFYNLDANGNELPLHVIRHGLRGTQNVNMAAASAGASAKTARREVSNIQTTDSAKLAADAVALCVHFDLKFIDLDQLLFACAPSAKDAVEDIQKMRGAFQTFVTRAKQSQGIEDVALRYARNIANARWLWRNRAVAESIQIIVRSGAQTIATIDEALDVPLNQFDDFSAAEHAIAQHLLAGMRGERAAKLSVRAEVRFGVTGAIEVFPSQNYLEDKPKGFARPLYTLGAPQSDQDPYSVREMGQAALRDQKVANALRTIDTWYPDFAERGQPIAVEPNGASLDAQTFFRNSKDSSAFSLMLQLDSLDPDSPEGRFLLACLIRGGVYSGDSKEAK